MGGTITEWTDRPAQIKTKNPTWLTREKPYVIHDAVREGLSGIEPSHIKLINDQLGNEDK